MQVDETAAKLTVWTTAKGWGVSMRFPPPSTQKSDMTTTAKDRAAMVARQLAPIALIETRPCWGRMGDGQCDACSLLTEPGATDLRSFPVLDVLVPDLVIRHIEGQDRMICRNRRTTGTHRPAALGASGVVSVGALGHFAHGRTVPPPSDQGKPLLVGG